MASEELKDAMFGAALLAGAANVIMQLSRPPVGYGVMESRVDSGNLFKRPVKRTRTTLTYLAVAALGSEEEKAAYRRDVNKAHAQVHSNASSPVKYNAFDQDLQLWVAACIYKGVEDTCALFLKGDPARFYGGSATLGTTLQVRPEAWPVDRDAFTVYWESNLDAVEIDEPVREYLTKIVDLRYLPWPVNVLLGPFHRFVTTGFLPTRFREQMHLSWSDTQQRRFDAFTAGLGKVVRVLPGPLRRFPYNAFLWDLRRRRRAGRPLA